MDFYRVGLIALLVLLSSCSSVEVSTDYDSASDFSTLKTFSWHPMPSAKESQDARLSNSIMYKRIVKAVEGQLRQQGYVKTSESPDFYVNFSVTSEDKVDIRTYDSYGGYGPGWGWGPGYGHRGAVGYGRAETVVTEYQQGTLIIDVVEPASNLLMWRGLGSKRLPREADSTELDELVDLVVSNVLQKFPPVPES